MKSFFKYFLASFVAFLIALLIGIFIFIGSISSMFNNKKETTIKPNSILKISLNQQIVDRTGKNPFENLSLGSLNNKSKIGLSKILSNIDKAKNDPNIKGIFLNVSNLKAGSATIQELRNKLITFKDSDKFIISYADAYSQKAYYLASIADKVYVNPEGLIGLQGLAAQVMFFKKTLAKIGVKPEIIRHGKFKSAVEPFMLDKMSAANREQIETYMGSIWDEMLKGISEARNVKVSELQSIADNMSLNTTEDAIKYKLIDGVRYYDQVIEELHEKAGVASDKKLNIVSLTNYFKAPKVSKDELITKMSKIAVIYAQGEIGSKKGNNSEIGTENIAKAICKARKDKKVKAIVLRVNSPGGSALTSEVIYREVTLAKKAKPFIVSMGDVAASGGYYISCMADTIVAQPTTITGSIGVFGLLFQAKELINKTIGINVETVLTAKHADMGSMFRPLTQDERNVIQKGVEDVYDTFIGHVAEGRHMTKAQVDSIGQGRVWSGVNAKKIGLVDVLGGLNDAIKIAAQMAKIENYRIKELPKQKSTLNEILSKLEGNSVLISNDNIIAPYLSHIKYLMGAKGIQARIPYNLSIQ